MKQTVKFTTLAALMLALVLAFNMSVTAQDGVAANETITCRNKAGIPNLTDAQTAKIKELKTAHMKEVLPMKNLLAEKKAHLKTLTTVDKVDMKAVNTLVDEIGAIKTDMMKKKIAMKMEIRNQLDEEQRLYFDLHNGKNRGMRGHGKGHGHGNGNGNGNGRGHGHGGNSY